MDVLVLILCTHLYSISLGETFKDASNLIMWAYLWGALQSTNRWVGIAEQIGPESSLKRVHWIGHTQSRRSLFQHLWSVAEKARHQTEFSSVLHKSHLYVDNHLAMGMF